MIPISCRTFTIFANVFPKPILGYAVLLYGGLVYYLILIGSGIMTIITHFQIKEKNTLIKPSDTSKI